MTKLKTALLLLLAGGQACAGAPDVIFEPKGPVVGESRLGASAVTRPGLEFFPLPLVRGVSETSPATDFLLKANATIAAVVRKFMSGMVPDENGIDQVVPDENPIDQFVAPINGTRFQWVMQGVGNLKALSGPYLYNEIQGGMGVEFDLFGRTANAFEDQSDTIVAFRVLPLYGEIAYIRMASGAVAPDNSLPSRTLLGSSFGIEIMRRQGAFEPGARAYVRPLIELNGAKDAGASIEAAVYCRIKLADMHWLDPEKKTNLYLTPYVAYYDRSTAIRDLDSTQEPDLARGTGSIRRSWIGGINLEIRR